MGRWVSSRETRGTVMQRCQAVEETMYKNLQEMRAYRQAIDEVQQRRKANSAKFMEELKQKPENIKLSDLKPASTLDPSQPIPKESKSMKERMAALEGNMESNQEALGGHRKVLDGILTARQEAQAAAAQMTIRNASGSAHLAAAARANTSEDVEFDDTVTTNEKCREINRNARWMGPAMQKAAVSKARTDDTKALAAQAAVEESSWSPQYGGSKRPRSAATPTSTARPGLDLTAPVADRTAKASSSRPLSAAAGARRPSRPGSAVSRPMSATSRGTGRSSRPQSAHSLNARFQNLQESVERNQEALMCQRQGIDMVVKLRQERAQRLTMDLLASIKEMYQQREAEKSAQ
eukprot:TRINITY_DN8505_c0_g1_i1.p1 TRINITY_DN8505_c0_g1~~TRINITY_DN8505_c0_g1_i1.p1  ORF type:complete len:367 (+),score=88.90 TRINITY_DN8505_c0_g1_i1:54-1103(+)